MSKTSVQAVLSVMIGILTSLLSYQVPTALQTPQTTHNLLWANVAANVLLLILKAVVGFMQGDAPKS